MIALDFLANPLQSPALNAILHNTSLEPCFANLNIFDNHAVRLDENNRAKVVKALGLEGYEIRRFDFVSAAFLELFSLCAWEQISIILASSLHQQSFYAGKLLASRSNFSWLHPSMEEGIITPCSLKQSIFKNTAHTLALEENQNLVGSRVVFLPFINHDLLSYNPIDKLLEVLLPLPNTFIVLDISLLLQLYTHHLIPLPTLPQGRNIAYICNGENLSLTRPSGFVLLPKDLDEPFSNVFSTLQSLTLPRPSLFEALSMALEPSSLNQAMIDSQQSLDTKEQFFTALKEHLGENLSLFAPLEHTAPNALALRLKGIKARMLLQSLHIEHIRAINGLDCLFGNAKPSFVLQSMGYSELQSRECLSISYESLKSQQILDITKRIAQHYKQLRVFDF